MTSLESLVVDWRWDCSVTESLIKVLCTNDSFSRLVTIGMCFSKDFKSVEKEKTMKIWRRKIMYVSNREKISYIFEASSRNFSNYEPDL